MPVTEVPARDFIFELNTGTAGAPTWVVVDGIDNLAHAPTTNRSDTRHFSDGGRTRHWVASRGDAFTMTGKRQEDPADGARDPGQLACEAWAQLTGPDSIKEFRMTSPPASGAEVITFEASAEVQRFGGGNDDPATWQLAVQVTGLINGADSDDVPAAPTAVTGTGGDTLSTLVSWTDPATGSPFTAYEVRVYLDADDSLVTTVTASTGPVHVPGLAAATTYYARVRAQNAAGWSPLSAESSPFTTAI